MSRKFTILFICFFVIHSATAFSQESVRKIDLSLAKEIDHSIKLGLKYLYQQQEDDGSWQHYPGITGLTLSAFLRAHPSISTDEPAIANGFEFLKSCIKPDGSIYLDDMSHYNTAICLMAFKDANNPAFAQIIANAEKFLMGEQIDESEDVDADSLYYGGVGYGGDDRPDLSNLHWAIEAIALDDARQTEPEKNLTPDEKARMESKKLFYDKALVFLSRCQNLNNVNSENYAGNDGGFMYEPGASKAGGTTSYGSMTYAGLKSLIYAKVDKNDERVVAAYDWIKGNYSVETAPGMGNQGLFYYYQLMAKSLNAFGQENLIDKTNVNHVWRNELANQLIKIQSPEGFWVNENGRWWENNPTLVTAYVILALEEIAGLPETTTIKKRNLIFKP